MSLSCSQTLSSSPLILEDTSSHFTESVPMQFIHIFTTVFALHPFLSLRIWDHFLSSWKASFRISLSEDILVTLSPFFSEIVFLLPLFFFFFPPGSLYAQRGPWTHDPESGLVCSSDWARHAPLASVPDWNFHLVRGEFQAGWYVLLHPLASAVTSSKSAASLDMPSSF